MKKTKLKTLLFLCGILVLASCKKTESTDPEPNPGKNPTNYTMASLTGTWKASGSNLAQEDQSGFSEVLLMVNADNTCTWTKVSKAGPANNLAMQGKITIEATGIKDAAGKPIDRIWFFFSKINGMDMSGSTHGIYQAIDSDLTLDWLFMKNGEQYPDPAKGFGSGRTGQSAISKYKKQ